MSWIQKLYETYDRCAGLEQFEGNPLPPISHAERQAHLEIALNGGGKFRRASIVSKEATLIPVTEKSAGQTSGAVAHPLCDKIRYVARDYESPFGEKPVHNLYLQQLRSWVASEPNPKLVAILKYVEKGDVVKDLVEQKLLWKDDAGKLVTEWRAESPPIARLLSPDPKTKQRDQGDALVRWRVELDHDPESAVWKDPQLHDAWMRYDAAQGAKVGLCMVSGEQVPLAFNHPRGLRYPGDAAKLISSNDKSGYTFRGRFSLSDEAYGIGSVVTQKAHGALRWLIKRQEIQGSPVVVCWAVAGSPTPQVTESSEGLMKRAVQDLQPLSSDGTEGDKTSPEPYEGDAGQAFSARLNRLISGYAAQLGKRNDIVVLALDSATKARMAVVYYRELQGSEFLTRIQKWHEKMAWPQNMGKGRHFIGAPAPAEIAEAAYGHQVEGKTGVTLQAMTVERLLPCIIDQRPFPRDLVQACAQRAANRAGQEHWEWERTLGIACALVRGSRKEKEYSMSLEEQRTTRDYLFGRLLAVAEKIEGYALYLQGEKRDTTAERLMQRFADHPASTWRTIELALGPYMARLRNSRGGALHVWKTQLDEIAAKFQGDDFTRPGRLDAEFLLGYHCQRAALNAKRVTDSGDGQADATHDTTHQQGDL